MASASHDAQSAAAVTFAALPDEVLSLIGVRLSVPPHGIQPAILSFCLTSRDIHAGAREHLGKIVAWRHVLRGFNSQTSPRRAAQWLREHALVVALDNADDTSDTELLATFLRSSWKCVEPRLLGELIGARGADSSVTDILELGVLEACLGDLEGCSLDQVLRRLTAALVLPGEAGKIERILDSIAQRWHAANPRALGQSVGHDTALVLLFSLVMLNVDRWSPRCAPLAAGRPMRRASSLAVRFTASRATGAWASSSSGGSWSASCSRAAAIFPTLWSTACTAA